MWEFPGGSLVRTHHFNCPGSILQFSSVGYLVEPFPGVPGLGTSGIIAELSLDIPGAVSELPGCALRGVVP